MKTKAARLLACILLASTPPARATDVDGPNDCTRALSDMGDAPEGTLAYPGVIGHFPSCLAPGAPGTRDGSCPFVSTPPLATGYVRHVSPAVSINYWLGCGVAAAPSGVDSEPDAKVNSTGLGASSCSPGLAVDCTETAFGLTFGQDECYGSTDAGIAAALTFTTCATTTISFKTSYCGATARTAFLNVLVDWNHDGDWNDAVQGCNTCVTEWAVRNATIDLPPGCFTQTSPPFVVGTTAGPAWMRITISDTPVNDDFPWAGSATMPGGELTGGETEDYPVTIVTPPPPCKTYQDFGDAPEGVAAYSTGIVGHFPTCLAPTAPGTPDVLCPDPLLPPPGLTGYVEHVTSDTDHVGYWLGCGDIAAPLLGVDSEPDGRSWLSFVGGQIAACDRLATPDCSETLFGMTFGQDECYGDADAGISSLVSFTACRGNTVTTKTYSCATTRVQAYLNVLVDWNGDGDWCDVGYCDEVKECVPEWAVKNQLVLLDPGCGSLTSKAFLGGTTTGAAWMRVTLSEQPAPDDFPWNGSVSLPGSVFHRGETEDYPVQIVPAPLGVGGDPAPGGLAFAPPAPNPATNGCTFSFTLPHDADVSLAVYDVAGREVAQVLSEHMAAGAHTQVWDFRGGKGTKLEAGLYLVKLRVGGVMLTRSVMHVR
jgi:hypothetical protein